MEVSVAFEKNYFGIFFRLLFCFRNILSQGFWTFLVDGCCADRATDQVTRNLKLVVEMIFKLLSE